MKIVGIASAIAVACILWAAKLDAKPVENVTVKIPFAFTAANRVLPAGTYRIELLTKGQPGVDEVEVIALRGVDTHSYAALVARLGRSEAKAPVMSFAQQGGTAVLAEVRANGKSYALMPAETDYAINQPAARFDMAPERTLVPAAATTGQQ